MGTDRTREIYRALVYELSNSRDAQRELKALIKARYRGWGMLRLNGVSVFCQRPCAVSGATASRRRAKDDAATLRSV